MKAVIALCVVVLSGCMSSQQDFNDIARMEVDCANAKIQIKYLVRQLTRPPQNGQSTESQQRTFNANARDLIWRIRAACEELQ